jgi:hypothetical protein
MVAATIISVSLVAFALLGLSYWRATISGIAAHAISERIRVAAGIGQKGNRPQDFRNIIILKDLSPDLCGQNECFKAICAYYSAIKSLGKIIPLMREWADAEMATCARYAAVLMEQHLERNMVYAAQVRGM